MSTKKLTLILAACAMLVVGFAADAAAVEKQPVRNWWGFRGGYSSSPDQIVLGGMMELGKPWGKASVVPSLDLGLGDNVTVWAGNLDLRWYLIPMPESGVDFYGSAGPSLVHYSVDGGGSGSELGLTLSAGARIPSGNNRYNIEARFGVGDIPDFRLMVGYLFR